MAEELVWWHKRYYNASRENFKAHYIMCQPDLAAVLVVFEHPWLTSVSITKYDINPNLAGKVRARAKKDVVKKVKRADLNMNRITTRIDR